MASNVLILGGGFGGLAVARRLERALRADEARITLVCRDNYALFTPMLPEVSSGGIETRHVVTPLRSELRRSRFVLGEIVAVDLDRREIEVHHTLSGRPQILSYDHLVLALGGVTSTFDIPGIAMNSLPLKTLEDAATLRNHIIALLELAETVEDAEERLRLLRIVVVGGGFTGVEAAGELQDFFSSVTRYYATLGGGEVSTVLVEGGARLLPELPEKMGRYAARALQRRGVEIVLGELVAGADRDALTLTSGRRLRTATIVWSAGVRPSPLAAALPVEHARGGAVVTAADMSVPGREGLWALGDCAAIPAPDGGRYPPTAQHAIREGPVLADNIVARLRDRPTKPFRYTSLGSMASLGARRGVAGLPNGVVVTGFPAWLIWRGYYLSRLPGLDRKLRVAFDWLLGLLFPRDISELRVYSRRSQAGAVRDAGLGSDDKGAKAS